MNTGAVVAETLAWVVLVAFIVLLVVLAVEWVRDRRAWLARMQSMQDEVMAELEAISPDWVEREQERFRREREGS